MTLTRSLMSTTKGPFRALRRRVCVYMIADLMHKLAHFSALDFEGFDEECFWRRAEEVGQADALARFDREAFEKRLNPGSGLH